MIHRLWFINYDSEIHFELFVQFAETGSCDSYDQYSNDRNNCNINQLPPKPEIINNYQGMTHILWLINPIFSSLENGLWELYTRGQLPEYWWVIPSRSDLHAEQKYMLALSKQRLVRHTKKCDTADSNASNSFFYSDFLWFFSSQKFKILLSYKLIFWRILDSMLIIWDLWDRRIVMMVSADPIAMRI